MPSSPSVLSSHWVLTLKHWHKRACGLLLCFHIPIPISVWEIQLQIGNVTCLGLGREVPRWYCCTILAIFLLPNPFHLPKVVANLFFGHAQVLARQRSLVRRSSTRTRRYKAPTVAARFQQSLLELVEKMER